MNPGPEPRPWWHKWFYGALLFAGCLIAYLILSGLTARINRAEDAAAQGQSAVDQLAAQVKRMGGTPVIDPDSLPAPEPGAQGAAGQTGAIGPAGPQGPAGSPGDKGEPGKTGERGPRGFPGTDGSEGTPGQDGASGNSGSVGPAGPAGPAGERGPQGEQGQQGPPGMDGQQGPAGPSCPSGYQPRERTIFTAENPLGEPSIICTPEEQAP